MISSSTPISVADCRNAAAGRLKCLVTDRSLDANSPRRDLAAAGTKPVNPGWRNREWPIHRVRARYGERSCIGAPRLAATTWRSATDIAAAGIDNGLRLAISLGRNAMTGSKGRARNPGHQPLSST